MTGESGVTVGLVGAGEMGAAVGAALLAAGHRVLTDLSDRSGETRTRAIEAGLIDRPLAGIAAEAAIIFSIVPPSVAEATGAAVAEAAGAAGDARLIFVDANAISPDLSRSIAAGFGPSVSVVDGGIIGMPPVGGARPRLYLSGPRPAGLEEVASSAFDVRHLGADYGAASAMKMVYASVTKGFNALLTGAFVLAERLDLGDAFADEMAASQAQHFRRAETMVAALPADAGRWVREMEEIRDTYEAAGLPGGFNQAAADIYRLLDSSPYGTETRRTRDRRRTLRATVATLAAQVK